ncbi:MAG: SoxS protein [Paracoccus sp. (in: a-proteobacteria)]|nr:SoxS protein [Paracoccus sp. (in: a-proteobacteria)]
MTKAALIPALLAAALLAAPLAVASGSASAASGTKAGAGLVVDAPPPPAAGQHAQSGDIGGIQLLMVEQRGCYYCGQWDTQIFPAYQHTEEGLAAPLLRVDLAGPYPDGLALARAPRFTPTFILLDDGAEIARIEGYPGDNFFWPQLRQLLARAGIDIGAEGGT